jgi:hypothetical protein
MAINTHSKVNFGAVEMTGEKFEINARIAVQAATVRELPGCRQNYTEGSQHGLSYKGHPGSELSTAPLRRLTLRPKAKLLH